MPPEIQNAFAGDAVNAYLAGPPRQVPGFSSLHRMTEMLLAERTPPDGRVLVLGAGGGLELKALAEAQRGWQFDGVDPSSDMLRLAETITAAYRNRVRLHKGDIEVAPNGPFDAATCLLTFHFIPRERRLTTLREIHRRLRGGAPFVVAHISFAQNEPERSHWLARHVAYPEWPTTDAARLQSAVDAMRTRLSIVSPADDEALLRDAGFSDVTLFYAGLSFRGWVAYA